MLSFGVLFAIISAVKAAKSQNIISPTSPFAGITPYLPSGIAFAVGFLNAPSFSIARLIGGYIAYRTAKASGERGGSGETPLGVIVLASGFVLGEGVFSIVNLIAKSAGLDAASCWGCSVGSGGYCAGRCT